MYYVYVFRIKETGKIIYVGSTRTIGERLNGHRRSTREIKREQPIHKYLKENNLHLLKDVEFSVIDYAENKQQALDLESYYFEKYRQTLVNIWKGENREKSNSPVRKPLKVVDKELYFDSQREAAEYYGVSRYQINKMTKAGLLIEVEINNSFINESTGEYFISAYQVAKRYDIDSKRTNILSREGKLIIHGMTIRKV
jgi:predicted GIY-YIG superfamily endonuclease